MHLSTRGRSFIIPSPPISAFRTFSSIIHIEHIYIVVVWYSIIIRIAVILTIIDPGTSTMTGWTAGGEGVLIGCLPSSFDHWTTNALRDGAPFLLLIETPPTFGRSVRFLHILHETFSIYYIPFLCGRLGYLFLLSGRSRPPTRKRSFRVFA